MYKDHQTLTNHGINLYSVKTDSFTLDEDKIELAKSLLDFDNKIGCWRLSKTENIIFSKDKFKKVKNKKYKLNKLKLQTSKLKTKTKLKRFVNKLSNINML